MEYYIVSFFISLVIFIFVYLYDYKSNNDPNYNNDVNYNDNNEDERKKPLFTTNNILLFIIIYIVSTIISFYTFTSSLSLNGLYGFLPVFLINLFTPPIQVPPLIKDNGDGDEIDPKILSKINDNFEIGFTLPIIDDSDIDTSDNDK